MYPASFPDPLPAPPRRAFNVTAADLALLSVEQHLDALQIIHGSFHQADTLEETRKCLSAMEPVLDRTIADTAKLRTTLFDDDGKAKPEPSAPEPDESIDSFAARAWADSSPPPPSARAEQLERYLADVDRLQKCAASATLLLKQQATQATTVALGTVVAEIKDGLDDLQRRRKVVVPNVRHTDDKLDAVNALGFDAHEPILNIEALLDVIIKRIDHGRDGHLIALCDLCIAEMTKLRFALYGEEMGP